MRGDLGRLAFIVAAVAFIVTGAYWVPGFRGWQVQLYFTGIAFACYVLGWMYRGLAQRKR